ncbi:SEN34 subunit of tRNA-splicing endonuclease [Xylariaceae sp. AK1471]|nr:SEN34 subunit of tRNA-splicing endonuclease [Xylariaceae sp. AK1471]
MYRLTHSQTDSIAASGKMASTSSHDRPLLRISKLAGRYLLFDIDDVMYLRRYHNICSVFVGTIPQNPQQNVFMGLPLELMPEEAQVLVDKKVAYIADDATFHPAQLAMFDESSRRAYLQSLKNQGKRLQMAAIESHSRNKPKVQQGKSKKKKGAKEPEDSSNNDALEAGTEADKSIRLFDSTPTPHIPANKAPGEVEGYTLTPTTSSFLLPSSSDPELEPSVAVDVPVSYPLFAHLHDKGYYMMPGLRFGCDYNVYPGDPLRFHSHFAGVHFGWDEEITMMDLVGGGRLATSVKKGYLFGGAIADGSGTAEATDGHDVSQAEKSNEPNVGGGSVAPPVRTFCLEWAGM